MIHTPYHFVPLSDWVYMPDWAHLVSHDVPFTDGFSGFIEFKLTNATPLCVGGEQKQDGNGPTKVMLARDPLGTPIIPGSSIKGMLRNVLEIATFGKLKQIEDSRFSFRDVSARSNYLQNVIGKNDVISGWVKYNAQKEIWEFRSCKNAKLKFRDLNDLLKINLKDEQPAVKKYQQVQLNQQLFAKISLPRGKAENCWAEQLSTSAQGDLSAGHVVFTNKKVTTKQSEDYEFCYFFHSIARDAQYGDVTTLVNQLFASHDVDLVQYMKQHPNTQIGFPVFMLYDKSSKRPHSFGFARMPRVSYKNSIHELVNKATIAHQWDEFFDLSELILGTLREEGYGLKSRVSFADAIPTQPMQLKPYYSTTLVLNGPKPTFGPAYLEQTQGALKYNDYDNDASRVNGWKRYVSKKTEHAELAAQPLSDKDKVSCLLELLPESTEFTGKIVFHNLKAVELGALLWVLEFEQQQGCYHGLGHGKPFGAGAVQLSVNNYRFRANAAGAEPTIEELKQIFVSEMNKVCNDWCNKPQIRHLLAMAQLDKNADFDNSYMPLTDFQQAKNGKQVLPLFNKIPRNDRLVKTDSVSLSFRKGRLSGLIEQGHGDVFANELVKLQDKRQDDLRRQEAKAQQAAAEAAKLAHEQQMLAQLSPGLQKISALQKFLQDADGASKPPKFRELVQEFIAENYCQESAAQLYSISRKHEFHKTPKARVDEHKQMLAKLVDKYQIKLQG
jgi:CRISPR-associated protein (TIGR03986 family)